MARSSLFNLTKGFMKKQITYLITVLLATVAVSRAAPPDKTTMQGKEKAAWQAFKDKNEADFKKVVDKDFVAFTMGAFPICSRQLDGMKKWDMKSFEISDYDMFSDEK